jgi:hypothetical protein
MLPGSIEQSNGLGVGVARWLALMGGGKDPSVSGCRTGLMGVTLLKVDETDSSIFSV